MTEREPFQPEEPMDAMAEMFRRQVMTLALDADRVTLYRELNPQQKIECFIAGALTGLVSVALCSVKSEAYDAIMEYLAECLPYAREQAESVRGENGETLKNLHDALSLQEQRQEQS